MSQYYFFVASLPYLSYDSPPPVSVEEFLDGAQRNLTPQDFTELTQASIEGPGAEAVDRGTLGAWNEFERGLRNALVRVRAGALEVAVEKYLRLSARGDEGSPEPRILEAARQSVADESPLAAEHMLGRTRWDFLGELETGHFFDLDALIVYYLKLQILSRNRLFSRTEGEQAYREATETIMNEYYQEQV